MTEKRYSRGMQTPRARNAMLVLIALLPFVLAFTIARPSVIKSYNNLIPVVQKNPVLFYIVDSL
jgi:hypothetical protein